MAFSMHGRLYQPLNPATEGRNVGGYGFFKRCSPATFDQFVVPYEACDRSTFLGKTNLKNNYKYDDAVFSSLAYDQNAQRTMTFDTTKELRFKVCDMKRNALDVNYAIAVYDIDSDFDSLRRGCVDIKLDPRYSRLYLLEKLGSFVYDNYTSAENFTKCSGIR
ncbi:uncharacterized protein LOC144166543 [Haemaphysalis longicornis]